MAPDHLSETDISRLWARVRARRAEPLGTLRPWLARELFDLWNPTKNPELRSAQWMNLGPADRRHWLDLAEQMLTGAPDDSGAAPH